MSIHISLSYQKKKEEYNKEDVLGVCLFYYFNKKKIKISTGVKTKFKDWNFNWEKSHSKEIIKKTDPDYIQKNLLIRQKAKEVEDIIYKINHNYEIPSTDLVKSYLKSNFKVKEKKSFKQLNFLFIIEEYLKSLDEKSTLRNGYKKTVKSNLKQISNFVLKY